LRRKANDILGRLSPSEREALLIKCWMSHDARWFMAVASEYGMEVANRLNRAAVHETGKVEAQRIVRALHLPPVRTVDDWLLAQEVFVTFLGPELMDYRVYKVGDNACQVHVQRCFANENAGRAGVAEQLDCGVFTRITGWLDALGPRYEISPPLGKCLKGEGQECVYHIALSSDPGCPRPPDVSSHG
jgi:hypothetical protein